MNPVFIRAKSIADAWFQLLYNLFDNGYRQDIQSGSFENEQYRIQYPGCMVYIEHPDQDIVPVIPPALGIPAPTTKEFIDDYFANYIMDPELAENETYKYASRIHERHTTRNGFIKGQLAVVTEMLKYTPMTNQAVLEIAKPSDIFDCYGKDGKLDPPCLRLIDFKVVPRLVGIEHDGIVHPTGTELILTIHVYFRSWDLWAGLPTNLGGIELLKQYVAQEAGLINGPMYAYSSGLHIYGYQEKFARIRTMKAAGAGMEE